MDFSSERKRRFCDETKHFLFVSYSHQDGDRVLPIINRLKQEGYNVWFDGGIDPGTEWDENIAMHIKNCSYFLAFVSPNYVFSKNCRDELNYSRDLDKEQLLVYLEDTELPEGMAMRMNRIQAIFWNRYSNVEEAFYKLFDAQGINKTRVNGLDPFIPVPCDMMPTTPAPVVPAAPEKKSKRFNIIWWILGWIFFFPAPLMILIWRNENKLKFAQKLALTIVIFVFITLLVIFVPD